MNNLLKTAFAEANTVSVENIEEPTVTVEQFNGDVLEITEATVAMENAAIVEEELQGVASGLEAIAAGLEAHQEEGIDSTAAKFLTLAVSAHTTRLGLESVPVASVENFGGATDSLEATKDSKSSIKDTLSNVLKVLANAIRKAMRKVGEFFTSLFKGLPSVIKRIDAVIKEVKALPDTLKDAEAKLVVPAAPRLHYEGAVTPAAIKTGLQNTATVWAEQTGILENVGDIVFGDKIKKVIESLQGEEAKEEEVAAELKSIGDEISELVSNGTKDGVTISGGYGVKTKGEEGKEAKIVVPVLTKVKDLPKVAETAEVAPFNSKEILDILGEAKSLANALMGKKKAVEGVAKARTAALKVVDEAVKAADKGKFSSAWAAGKARVAVGITNKGVDKCVNQLASHSFQVVRASIALAEKNSKLYGEPKAAKKEEGKKED